MRVIIVDNEKGAIANTRLKCRRIEDITEIFCFEDTEMALAFAEAHIVDLALLGIEIGAMDGLSLCVALKQINPVTAVIFLTAYPKYALEAFRCDASGFLVKPFTQGELVHKINNALHIETKEKHIVFIRTFGNFDLFVDDRAVEFHSAKAKELLALLVDWRGGILSPEQAVTYLWEDRVYDDRSKNLFRSVLKKMMDTLRQVGAEDIIQNKKNNKSINMKKVRCDLYEYLSGDGVGAVGYFGQYMEQYSWGHATKGTLEYGKNGKSARA